MTMTSSERFLPSRACLRLTIAIALICFICGFIAQMSFHLVPSATSPVSRQQSGNYEFNIDGKSITLSYDAIKQTVKNMGREEESPTATTQTISQQLTTSASHKFIDDSSQIPNIIKAWRSAQVDWHSLVPPHNSFWERFGTPMGEGKLRALVSKEILITDYLTRFQESGLSGLYGLSYGPLLSYSGCNAFASSCMVHTESTCSNDQLCTWSSSQKLCVDAWESDGPSTTVSGNGNPCPNPEVMSSEGFIPSRDRSQCKIWVDQPAVQIAVDSESQSMFYHWWAAWSGIVTYWKQNLHSRRDVHFFVDQINDPMFFQFFGLLSDNCWRRKLPKLNPPSVCYCNTDKHFAGQTRVDPQLAADQMLEFLGLQDTKPPRGKVRIGLISRRRKRFILNEYDLVRKVISMGYDCVLLPLETMTLFEQMEQLRSIHVLVGIHGSALDNAVFLHPGSVLVQLLPYKVEHRITFRATAEAAGVKYMEWQLKDPNLAVFHWDLLLQANADTLKKMTKEEYLERGQAAAGDRETLMFWINQDIIVPLNEWENVIRSAIAEAQQQ